MDKVERERFVKYLNEQTKKLCVSKETARRYLIDVLGTHNEDGTLTKEYGGEYTTKKVND